VKGIMKRPKTFIHWVGVATIVFAFPAFVLLAMTR
jgi:hypothetical protein